MFRLHPHLDLSELKVRMSSPVFPGQTLLTQMWLQTLRWIIFYIIPLQLKHMALNIFFWNWIFCEAAAVNQRQASRWSSRRWSRRTRKHVSLVAGLNLKIYKNDQLSRSLPEVEKIISFSISLEPDLIAIYHVYMHWCN